jgi:hypothetical protein
MSDEKSEDREQILNIDFEVNRKGEIFGKFGYSLPFFMALNKNDVERETFLSELIETLNGYINGATNE